MGNEKKCTKCKLPKDKSEFCKVSANKDGLCNHCRKCRAIANKKWDAENKEHRQIQNKIYRERHPLRCKKENRRRYIKRKAEKIELEELREYKLNRELNFPDEK